MAKSYKNDIIKLKLRVAILEKLVADLLSQVDGIRDHSIDMVKVTEDDNETLRSQIGFKQQPKTNKK